VNRGPLTAASVLAGATLLACTGVLDYEPSAYFGGATLTDAGAVGSTGVNNGSDGSWAPAGDGSPGTPEPSDGTRPPASRPDAAPGWEGRDTAGPWDTAPPPPDAMAAAPDVMEPPPAPPDAAAAACAPADGLALLNSRCGGCHNPGSAAKGLDLRSAGLAARVVGVASTCQGRPLLVAGPGTLSGHLLDKLDGPIPGCGNQMPFGMPALSPSEKACVRDWAAQAIAKVQSGKVMP
jgi:mono/diheme cytochrome c family protein